MATLATPARQPFGLLNDTKLRTLQSVKNRQNALAPNSAPSLKRRHASPELSDSENVDPSTVDTLKKRKRASMDDDISMSKASKYNLTTFPSTKPRLSTATPTPRLDLLTKTSITPASAPTAAGRSPTKPKLQGILGSRRRFAPPSFGIRSPSLSITAALNGTLASKKPKKVRTLEESKPKSWFFDVFEESEEQQDYNMNEWNMTQSATILDISDDEGKAKSENDRGKENVDPNEFCAPITRAMAASKAAAPRVARKDLMTDEVRMPLGDLNAVDYYAEGLDATSVVLVHEDVVDEEKEVVAVTPVVEATAVPVEEAKHFTFQAPTSLALKTAEVDALLLSAAPVWDTETLVSDPAEDAIEGGSGDIEIWESESAKGEDDDAAVEVGSVFALQAL